MAASEEKTAHNLLERKRTSDVMSSETINVDFASLMLSDPVQKGLTSAGFEKPSPIQLKAIPLGRCGLDLIVQAKSGTGKTCVFGVIALESVIATSNSLQILILAPTREIAVQIQAVIQAIGGAIEGLKCHTFIGGTIFGQDRQNLKKCHIAVGTPGRIKQLIEYDVMKTDSIRLFILDEADKLLDERFQASVNWIYHHLPENKQMLALSATYPETLAQQLTNYMRDPTFVRLNPKDLVLQGIKQFYKIVPGHHLPHKSFQIKADHLVDLLSQIAFNQCLIFSNLQSRAQNLCDLLLERGWPVTYISGNQEQVDRMKAMAELKTYKCRILISTDLTARGIDAENVNLIINLDVPTDFKTYLHRIGRAGRYGTHGAAITLASEGSEVGLLKTVQKRSGSDIKVLPDPLPSHLLELTFQEVETEVLGPESRVLNNASGDTVEEMTSSGTVTPSSGEANVKEYVERKNVVAVIDEGGDRKVEDERQESEKEDAQSGGDGGTGIFQNVKLSQNDITRVPLVDSEDDKTESEVFEDRNRKWSDHSLRGGAIWSMKNELEDWLVPMAIVQQAKETSRKRWTWQEAVKIFQDGGSDADEVVGRGVLESNSVAELENVGKSEYASRCQRKELLSEEETDVKTTDSDAPSSACENEEMTSEMTQTVKDGKSSGETLELNEKRKKNDEDDVKESLKYLKDSDILEEFRTLQILAEQVKTGELVLEMQDLYPGFPRRDELDHDSSCHEKISHDCNETSLRASSRNRNVVEKELGNVRSERLYIPKLHSGREEEEKQGGSSHFDCGEDLKLNKKSTSSQRTGRPNERIQPTGGDVTEGAAFSYKGKVIAEKGMKINHEGRQKARNATNTNVQDVNDDMKDGKGKNYVNNINVKYQVPSDPGKSLTTKRANLQGNHGNTNDDNKKPENIGCKTSDKIWEYFKLFAKTYSQDVSREKVAVCPDEGQRDSKQENKEEIEVNLDEVSSSLSCSDDENETSVKNEMDKLHPGDGDFSEISSLSSEFTQESDLLSSMTDQYGVTDRQTETDFYYADLDRYPDCDTSYFGAEWSEKSSVKSKVKQIPEFGPTFVDAPVSNEACAYSDEEEELYSYYWNEADRTAAEGWENYYGRSLQLWDGGHAYYDDGFNSPYYYEGCYPDMSFR